MTATVLDQRHAEDAKRREEKNRTKLRMGSEDTEECRNDKQFRGDSAK